VRYAKHVVRGTPAAQWPEYAAKVIQHELIKELGYVMGRTPHGTPPSYPTGPHLSGRCEPAVRREIVDAALPSSPPRAASVAGTNRPSAARSSTPPSPPHHPVLPLWQVRTGRPPRDRRRRPPLLTTPCCLCGSYEPAVRREIVVLRQLKHAGIARLVASFRWKLDIYLLIEYAARGDLHGHLRRMGSLALPNARFLFAEVGSARNLTIPGPSL
jgi:hypothetical protein